MPPPDFKRIEANEKRKVAVRDLLQLPHSIRNNILHIIGVEGKRSDYFQTCVTCEHFEIKDAMGTNGAVETCKLVGSRPPAQIIADGCEKYVDFDDIPF